MRARPRRGVLGLRGRIVGLVLFTTAATLAVAALTLLGPLESKLRNSARGTLEHDVRTASINNSSLSRLDLTHVLDYIAGNPEDPYYRQGASEWAALQRELTTLDSRLGGTTVLLGFPGPDGEAAVVAPLASSGGTSPYNDVAKLFFAWDNLRHGQPRLQSSLGTDHDGTE